MKRCGVDPPLIVTMCTTPVPSLVLLLGFASRADCHWLCVRDFGLDLADRPNQCIAIRAKHFRTRRSRYRFDLLQCLGQRLSDLLRDHAGFSDACDDDFALARGENIERRLDTRGIEFCRGVRDRIGLDE